MRALASLLLLVCAACSDAAVRAADHELRLTVEPDPPSVGPSQLTLAIRDAAALPVTGARVELECTMSHAGMVPVFGTTEERSPGVYVAELELTMGGDWIVIVDATLADGRSLERQLEVRGVRAKREP